MTPALEALINRLHEHGELTFFLCIQATYAQDILRRQGLSVALVQRGSIYAVVPE